MSNYNGNQLIGILDEAGNQNQYGLKEYHSAVPYSYDTKFTYDANGNMKQDLDRDIVTIKYNLLNLPELVQFRNGNQIINSYDASGRKLRTDYFTVLQAVLQPLNPGETCQLEFQTDVIDQKASIYMDNIEYELHKDPDMSTQSDWISLSKIHNAEGYADNLSISYGPIYYYYRRDHLGNNREVWRAPYTRNNKLYAGATAQRTQYYPSGLPWAESTGAGVQPYKYNSKEFVEMHGLDEYYSIFRNYYPAIGRPLTMDPLAEKYYSTSPYAWCGNNFVNAFDPDGRDWYSFEYEEKDENGETKTLTGYKYVEGQMSEEKMKKGKYTHLGKTHTDGNTYYSLFGSKVDANSDEGQIYQKVDEGIMRFANRQIETMQGYSGPEDNFYTLGNTNFSIPGVSNQVNFSYEGSYSARYINLTGKGGNVARMSHWIGHTGMPIDLGGHFGKEKAYHIVFQNDMKGAHISAPIHIKFKEREASILLRKYYNLFPELKRK